MDNNLVNVTIVIRGGLGDHELKRVLKMEKELSYYTINYHGHLFGILEQRMDGTDSIGLEAKENAYINSVKFESIPDHALGTYLYIPIVKAKDMKSFLLNNDIVPY